MISDCIDVGVSDGVGFLRIDRPEKANALRLLDKRAMIAGISKLQDEDGVDVIVIGSNAPGVFCAGTDIREMAGMGVQAAIEMFEIESEMFRHVLESRRPVIAAVDGVALGAGCILAYCADLCVATDRSVFGQPEVRNGVPAPAEIALLPYLVGYGRARSMLLSGRELSATEAVEWGLVHSSVSPETQEAELAQLVQHVRTLPKHAVALQKVILLDALRFGLTAASSKSQFVAATAFASEEPQRAIEQFLSGRRIGKEGKESL